MDSPAFPAPPFGAHSAQVFIILETPTIAVARLEMSLVRVDSASEEPLRLMGRDLAESTQGVWLNGEPLDWRAMLSEDGSVLSLPECPAEALFCCETRLALSPPGEKIGGLWSENGRVEASCDPQGFHSIAWAPEALAFDPEWSCEIEARLADFSSLEANGVLADCQVGDGIIRARYHDYDPKPMISFRVLALKEGPDA